MQTWTDGVRWGGVVPPSFRVILVVRFKIQNSGWGGVTVWNGGGWMSCPPGHCGQFYGPHFSLPVSTPYQSHPSPITVYICQSSNLSKILNLISQNPHVYRLPILIPNLLPTRLYLPPVLSPSLPLHPTLSICSSLSPILPPSILPSSASPYFCSYVCWLSPPPLLSLPYSPTFTPFLCECTHRYSGSNQTVSSIYWSTTQVALEPDCGHWTNTAWMSLRHLGGLPQTLAILP